MKREMKNSVTDFNRFSEEEIRPEKFSDEHCKALLEDVNMLLSRYKEFVKCGCPACDSIQNEFQFSKRGFDYVQCKNCQTLFINPRPSEDILNWFYRESKNYVFWNKTIFPATENARYKNIILPRIKKTIEICQKYNVNMESILEVGAGFGTFCIAIQSQKIFNQVIAIEPTPDLADTCRKKGIETIELPIEKIEFSKNILFDVIVSFEVIEHLFSPKNFLQHIFHLLKPGGIVILSCPNGKGFDIQVLREISDTIDHEHLNYFNPFSISTLLNSCGFKILEISTPGKLDAELVRKKVLNDEFNLSYSPFLQHILIEKWDLLGNSFQHFLIENVLSSNMWAVAQRP